MDRQRQACCPGRTARLSLLALCAAALAAGAARPAPTGMEIMAGTPRSTLLYGEPLVVDLQVRVTEGPPQDIIPILSPGDAGIRITDAEGNEFSYRDPVGAVRKAPPEAALRLGRPFHSRLVLLYSIAGEGGYVFPHPGRFMVRVVRRFGDRSAPLLTSTPIAAEIREPTGSAKDASEQFAGISKDLAIGGGLRADQQQLSGLAESYPDTPFGRYAAFYLAEARMSRGQGSERAEAAASFASLVDAGPPFPLADECLLELGRYHRQKGDLEAAVSALKRLRREHPESPFSYDCLVYLADCYHQMGDRAEARAALGEAVGHFASWPGSPAYKLAQELRRGLAPEEGVDGRAE